MKGLLVYNGFVKSQKFNDIYALILSAAKKRGIDFIKKSTLELAAPLGEKIFDRSFDCSDGSLDSASDSSFDRSFSQTSPDRSAVPDFCVFWDKDVNLARRLESENIRLFNRASAIEACDNKILTCTALCSVKSVKIPKTLIAPKTFEGVGYSREFAEKAADILGFPLVLKEAFGSFGKQVYLIKNKAELAEKLAEVGYKDVLLQQFVSSSFGKDVRVNVVGGEVVACMLRYNDGDFRSNISNGGKMRKTQIPREWENAAINACTALNLDFAGVDVMFGEQGEPIICEVNSNPHFRSTLECTEVNMSERIIDYILSQNK